MTVSPVTLVDGRLFCQWCGSGTDEPMREQGIPFAHTQDCDWLVANVTPNQSGWRDTPGATKSPNRCRKGGRNPSKLDGSPPLPRRMRDMAKPPFDPVYGPIVMRATGCERDEVYYVMAFMRYEAPTLDALTHPKFSQVAKRAYATWVASGKTKDV